MISLKYLGGLVDCPINKHRPDKPDRDCDFTIIKANGVEVYFWLTEEQDILLYKMNNGRWDENKVSFIKIDTDEEVYFKHSEVEKWVKWGGYKDVEDDKDLKQDVVLIAYKKLLSDIEKELLS